MHAKPPDHKSGRKSARAPNWLVKHPRAIPLAIFMAVAAITVFSVFAIEKNERQIERAQMSEASAAIASSLKFQVKDATASLRAGAAVFASVEPGSPGLFSQFINQLETDPDQQGALGIGWAAVANNKRGLEGGVASIVAEDAYVSSQGVRKKPMSALELYSDPVRRSAMVKAIDSGQPSASGKFELAGANKTTSPGFAIFLPVIRDTGGVPDVIGFFYSQFDANTLLESALANSGRREMSARLYDSTVSPQSQLAGRSSSGSSETVVERVITLADRDFVLAIDTPGGGWLTRLSRAALLVGLTVASLLMVLAHLLSRQALEDQTRLAFFEEQYSIRNSLTRELNHRVKNTLANVLSILSLTRRRSTTIDELADSLDGRIRALSATHDLLTHSEWGTTEVAAVIEAELAHISGAHDQTVDLDGPSVELAPNDALTFGQAIHELATNAAKFGSLSGPGGTVSVNWRLVGPNLVEVEWRERGGPLVSATRVRGFGTDLIEKIVAHELKQPVTLEFEPEGVRCVLCVTVRQRDSFQIRAGIDNIDEVSARS